MSELDQPGLSDDLSEQDLLILEAAGLTPRGILTTADSDARGVLDVRPSGDEMKMFVQQYVLTADLFKLDVEMVMNALVSRFGCTSMPKQELLKLWASDAISERQQEPLEGQVPGGLPNPDTRTPAKRKHEDSDDDQFDPTPEKDVLNEGVPTVATGGASLKNTFDDLVHQHKVELQAPKVTMRPTGVPTSPTPGSAGHGRSS